MSLLRYAAYDGDDETVSQLLEAGAAADERDATGYTPLLWACFRAGVGDYVATIRTLVGAGADIEASTLGKDALNCLMLAVQSRSEPAVLALLGLGAAVDARVEGRTALMIAAGQGETSIARLLLGAGADPTIRCGSYTASGYASYYGYDSLASELMVDPHLS